MLKTIMIGQYMSVQGIFVSYLANGLMAVRVGDRVFKGLPVDRKAA